MDLGRRALVIALSTHVLDTARGAPASGIPVRLYAIDAAGERRLVAERTTNPDGRTDAPLGAGLDAGTYELVFEVAAYFANAGVSAFFDEIAIRCRLDRAVARYHVPLLLSPWGYTTYRGS